MLVAATLETSSAVSRLFYLCRLFFLSLVFTALRTASNSSPSPSPSSILSCASAKGSKFPVSKHELQACSKPWTLQCSRHRGAAGDPARAAAPAVTPQPLGSAGPGGTNPLPLGSPVTEVQPQRWVVFRRWQQLLHPSVCVGGGGLGEWGGGAVAWLG